MSVIVTEPEVVPLAVGVKVTLTLQEAPAATLAPQLLVWEKGLLTVMLVIESAALPVFSSVKL